MYYATKLIQIQSLYQREGNKGIVSIFTRGGCLKIRHYAILQAVNHTSTQPTCTIIRIFKVTLLQQTTFKNDQRYEA